MSSEADRTEILGNLMPGYAIETSLPETLTQKMWGKVWAHVTLKHFPDFKTMQGKNHIESLQRSESKPLVNSNAKEMGTTKNLAQG